MSAGARDGHAEPSLALGPGGEFDVVRRLLARWGDLGSGIGGDCAVLDVPAGARVVVSTDTSVEHVHFRRDWLTAREIGHRATAAALSDLAAAAATPLGLVLAMTVPLGWRGDLDALADGVGDVARHAGCPIVGGDLSAGGELSLTVTVLGHAARPLARDGVRPGDALWVTGRLGGPTLALAGLLAGRTPAPEARERFARPLPRLAEARWLAEHGARAAVDISDGLAADARHLAAASGVALAIDAERVPRVAGADARTALASGEEYELLVAAPASLDAAAFAARFGLPLTRIGTASAGPAGVTARVDLPPGHDHFSG